MGTPGATVMYDFPRLDVGRMALRPAGKITGGTLRQDLWNAEITGTICTERGALKIRALTVRDHMVNLIEVESTEKDAAGKPLPWRWEFRPGNPSSPRALTKPEDAAKLHYETNPPPKVGEHEGVPVCVQPLLAGGDFATAWLEQKSKPDARFSRLWISTANEVPVVDRSASVAVASVREAASADADAWFEAHQKWWHRFYPAAFVSVPDARLEAFYWIQMYKLGAASREGGPAIDLFGPWYRTSTWPGIWWNLNIQLTYWPTLAGNHLEVGDNYLKLVDDCFESVFLPQRDGKMLGDFVWALHNYWWQLRFAGDWEGVQARWVPKARSMLEGYTRRLKPNADGRLELPDLGSPEFKGFQPFRNPNYNLGLLRWLLSALIEADERAGNPASPERAEWKRLQTMLVDYPVDETGLRIASDQPLDESHRHFSHLLPLYPLYQLNPDEPQTRELLVRSLRHWHQIGDGKALAGYSFTGGAALYASLGMGDDALGMLHSFLNNAKGRGTFYANTMYAEAGGHNPVIETPLSGASAVMDLLLQSWGGKIRVFPAVPGAWSEVAFHQLRAMDGFLISARRERGQTAWVEIQSEAGEPCLLNVPDWKGRLTVEPASVAVEPVGPGLYRIGLAKGAKVALWPEGKARGVVAPVASLSGEANPANPFGVKLDRPFRRLPQDQSWPEFPVQPVPLNP
jgi:hypothetical protein